MNLLYCQQPEFVGGSGPVPMPLNGYKTINESIKATIPDSLKNSYYSFDKKAMVLASLSINDSGGVDSVFLLFDSGYLEIDNIIISGLKETKYYWDGNINKPVKNYKFVIPVFLNSIFNRETFFKRLFK